MPGSARYYTSDKVQCSDDVCFSGKDKYPKEILMWIVISNRDMSNRYFGLSNSVAVNTDINIGGHGEGVIPTVSFSLCRQVCIRSQET